MTNQTDNLHLLKRIALMSRQMGNLHGSLLFSLRGVDGNATDVEQNAYKEQLRCDLADVIVQSKILAEELGYDWLDIQVFGMSRYREAKENFAKKGKIEQWI